MADLSCSDENEEESDTDATPSNTPQTDNTQQTSGTMDWGAPVGQQTSSTMDWGAPVGQQSSGAMDWGSSLGDPFAARYKKEEEEPPSFSVLSSDNDSSSDDEGLIMKKVCVCRDAVMLLSAYPLHYTHSFLTTP